MRNNSKSYKISKQIYTQEDNDNPFINRKNVKPLITQSRDESTLLNEKDNILGKLNSLDKEIHDIKFLFESVKSVYNKNKEVVNNEEVYLRRSMSLSSSKVTPKRKEIFTRENVHFLNNIV